MDFLMSILFPNATSKAGLIVIKSRGQKNQGDKKIKGTGTSIADGNSKKIKGTGTSIADGNSSNREFIPGYCHRKKFRISAPLIGKVHF